MSLVSSNSTSSLGSTNDWDMVNSDDSGSVRSTSSVTVIKELSFIDKLLKAIGWKTETSYNIMNKEVIVMNSKDPLNVTTQKTGEVAEKLLVKRTTYENQGVKLIANLSDIFNPNDFEKAVKDMLFIVPGLNNKDFNSFYDALRKFSLTKNATYEAKSQILRTAIADLKAYTSSSYAKKHGISIRETTPATFNSSHPLGSKGTRHSNYPVPGSYSG